MARDLIVPPGTERAHLLKLLHEFIEEDTYASKQFWSHFQGKQALKEIPSPSLSDAINHSVVYNSHNEIDCRMLILLVHPEDRKLAKDVIAFVGERYAGKPASDLTLRQFRADLARRMCELKF